MTIWQNRSETWTARFMHQGERFQRTFQTKAEAAEWQAHMRELVQSPDDWSAIEKASAKGNNVAALLKICLDLDWREHSDGHRNHVLGCAREAGWDLYPRDMTMQWLDGMVARLKGRGLSNGRVKNYMNAYRVMLKRAQRLGWIKTMPLFPEGRTLPPAEPRDLVLDDSWVAAMLTHLESEQHRLLVRFLHLTGARVSEALKLEWSRCSFERRRIQFIKTKTTNARALPMSKELRDILVKCQRMSQSRPFSMAYADFYKDYKAAKTKVCLELHLDMTVHEEWVIHTLRHTCLTQLAMRGASAIQIMEWAGHKSLSTSQKYVHTSSINLEALAGFSSCLTDDSAQPLRQINPPEPVATTGVSPFDHRSSRTFESLDDSQ